MLQTNSNNSTGSQFIAPLPQQYFSKPFKKDGFSNQPTVDYLLAALQSGSCNPYAREILQEIASSSGCYIVTIKYHETTDTHLDKKQYTYSKLTSTKEQITALKIYIGLNISEIASIFQVSRPTIYEWLESDTPKKHRGHPQKKLETIYQFCSKWQKTGLGRMGNYLYKSTAGNKSFLELLSEEKLDLPLIESALQKIEDAIRTRNLQKEQDEQLLKQHGFEEVTKEEMERNFNKIIKRIS